MASYPLSSTKLRVSFIISCPRKVTAETSLGLKNRHSVAPSTPANEFISSFKACDKGSFFTRLASSRAVESVVTISGRQCLSRENTVSWGPRTPRVGSARCMPCAKPTGSTRKVRMIEGYRLL
ncbi:hypothetical protein D3C78_1540160 [compost metagenome]